MPRFDRFTFLINADERRMIATLGEQLNRSQSDAIRFVIAQSIKALADPHPTPTNAARTADALPTLSRQCSICHPDAMAGQQNKRESWLPCQRRQSRLHWGYLLAAVILAALLLVGSPLIFPDWTRTNGSVLVLLVIVAGEVVQFVANWRTAFDAPPDGAQRSEAKNG